MVVLFDFVKGEHADVDCAELLAVNGDDLVLQRVAVRLAPKKRATSVVKVVVQRVALCKGEDELAVFVHGKHVGDAVHQCVHLQVVMDAVRHKLKHLLENRVVGVGGHVVHRVVYHIVHDVVHIVLDEKTKCEMQTPLPSNK